MGAQLPREAILRPYIRTLIRSKVRQLCRKPRFSRNEQQDLEQDLMLRLLRKIDRYDPARGASFDTFADRVVHSEIAMILRERKCLKRAGGYRTVSLDLQYEDEASRSLHDIIGSDQQARRLGLSLHQSDPELAPAIQCALAALPPWVVEVAKHLQQHTENATAELLGVSRRRIREAKRLIRERFEELGLTPE